MGHGFRYSINVCLAAFSIFDIDGLCLLLFASEGSIDC